MQHSKICEFGYSPPCCFVAFPMGLGELVTPINETDSQIRNPLPC